MINLLGSYRPGRVVVSSALILALLTPAVTYACEMTGLITMSVPMTMAMSHHDTPVPGPHDGNAPAESAACDHEFPPCGLTSECGFDAMEADACYVSYPGLEEGLVTPSQKPVLVPVYDAIDLQMEGPDLTRSSTPTLEFDRPPARHRSVPLHLSYSSLLL